jgi:hypothetical protein
MPISPNESNIVRKYLLEGETIKLMVRQQKLHKEIAPTIFVITNERVIVIARRLVPNKIDVDSIPFKDIMAVRFEEGIIFSSVFLRLTGTMPKEGFLGGGEEHAGELTGLSKEDAKMVSDYIEKAITPASGAPGQNPEDGTIG